MIVELAVVGAIALGTGFDIWSQGPRQHLELLVQRAGHLPVALRLQFLGGKQAGNVIGILPVRPHRTVIHVIAAQVHQVCVLYL